MRSVQYQTPTHMFEVGQTVRFRSRLDRPPHSAEDFQIVRVLPPAAGSLQYRIRNVAEPYERVATEDRLELVDVSGASAAGSLEKRVFGEG